ncbi:MAG: S8 family serine peptidase [Candidatus Aminicenantales bacterium]
MKEFIFSMALSLVLSAGTAGLPAAQKDSPDRYQTRLNPGNELGIVRRPGPQDLRAARGAEPKELPVYKPGSKKGWDIDLISADVSGWDLSGRGQDLLYASFDSRTIWPELLPSEFDPLRIIALGKNPGLGIRSLHELGIRGENVGIAVLDTALLVDHVEYRDRLRLYEEIHCGDEFASTHGPAMASIAVGKTVGVAPGADLYFIARSFELDENGEYVIDHAHLARSIDRILEINRGLPEKRKIRVISVSIGWAPSQQGYAEVTAAMERAEAEGIFVVSSSIGETSGGKFYFHGLGRNPLDDPEALKSYRPGMWWSDDFHMGINRQASIQDMLIVPMDSRSAASPTGTGDYAFYRSGGWSCSIPYIAGLYALACQVKPEITPEAFWTAALQTGDSIVFPGRRAVPAEDELAREIAKNLDWQIMNLKKQTLLPFEDYLAANYNRITGKNVATMSEADFRAWATAGPLREQALADTKPRTLEKIVNPVKLIEALRQGR